MLHTIFNNNLCNLTWATGGDQNMQASYMYCEIILYAITQYILLILSNGIFQN